MDLFLLCVLLLLLASSGWPRARGSELAGGRPGGGGEAPAGRAAERGVMVDEQLVARGVRDAAVLAAMRRVPRHLFVPPEARAEAYRDGPLDLGLGQTISQPFVVAAMTAALELKGGERVLEVGAGSGYQTAVLAAIVRELHAIEILPELAARAERVLAALGHADLRLRVGDGWEGWPEQAPFDAILLAAAPSRVPPALLEQLAVGGRLVLPVGENEQQLVRVRRTSAGYEQEQLFAVRFVPMTGGEGID